MSIAVLHAVARRYYITPSDLIGRSRHGHLVAARAVAAFIMREGYRMPFRAIGARLGGRDHTTIMHLVNNKALSLVERDSELAAFVAEHVNGPMLPPPIVAFVPRAEFKLSRRVTDPEVALAHRVRWAARVSGMLA